MGTNIRKFGIFLYSRVGEDLTRIISETVKTLLLVVLYLENFGKVMRSALLTALRTVHKKQW